jgi:membrane protease YdiL (CAAX protease family)
MRAASLDVHATHEHPLYLGVGQRLIFAVVCLCLGIIPFARWIPGDLVRIGYVAVLLAFALFARTQQPSLRKYWELAFAFAIFGLVALLDGFVNGYVGTSLLHDPPNGGDPLASTVSGTVVIQLLDALSAIVPVVVLTRISGQDLSSIYVRKGVLGRWFIFAIVFFVVFYVFLASLPLRPDSLAHRLLPENGTLTLGRFLILSPALLLVSLSNGFEEEFLFRGLFLQKYEVFFGARVTNVLQAMVFASAHVGITYTPNFLLFAALLIFPLGLLGGYLMRATNSVITPGIFHGALDMGIYLAFLSYAS